MNLKIKVVGYDEGIDVFQCVISGNARKGDIDVRLPGSVLANLVGECGEPCEFQGRTFNIPSDYFQE